MKTLRSKVSIVGAGSAAAREIVFIYINLSKYK